MRDDGQAREPGAAQPRDQDARRDQPVETPQRPVRPFVRVEQRGQRRRPPHDVVEHPARPVRSHAGASSSSPSIPSVGAQSQLGRYVLAYTNS